jgi:hypothetical protein
VDSKPTILEPLPQGIELALIHGPLESGQTQFTHVWTAEESRRLGNGSTYDAELSWVHSSAVQSNGVDDSKTFYHYEADGARKVVNFPGKPCRIHAYGNSFTHCDQVNDNGIWEEYLAAHLQEPVRNYGVGGYGVYQAYRYPTGENGQ